MKAIKRANNHSQNIIVRLANALVVAGVVACAGSGFAQTLSIQSGSTIGTAQADSIVQIAAESQGLIQVDPTDLPIVGGTFWWVMPGGNAVPAPCPPLDLSGAIYQIADGQFLVDETGGQVVANTHRFGLQAQATSSTVASEIASQANAVVNLITQVQATAANQQMQATAGNMMAMDVPMPGDGGGDGGINAYTSNYSSYTVDYGTNLFVTQIGIVVGNLVGIISNSVADIPYQILSCENLAQVGSWAPEGALVYGSETTNWTPFSVAMNNRQNLFIRILSWQDSTGSGIPDWWWLQYFGQITNVDAYAANPAGDGYNNLQKFQMGLNPTNYYYPNAPTNFYGCLDATGTNVVIEWSPSPGPVVNYVIQRGIYNTNTGNYDYSQFMVNSNAIFFRDVGAINNDNAWNDIYNLQAAYPGGTLTAPENWYAWYAQNGWSGPPYGAPMPGEAYAYVGSDETNVLLSWTPALGAPGLTSYIILRGVIDTNISEYVYSQIATLNTNTTLFQDVGAIKTANDWQDVYEVEAVYPGNGVSQPATAYVTSTPPPPTELSATVGSTGTNILISWTPPQGVVVSNYIIVRGIYDTNAQSYSYSQIGQVNASTTSFEDVGAITSNNSYNNIYEVEAIYPGGSSSNYGDAYLPGPPSLPSASYDNIYITAYLVRNGTGRWQVMFSGFPTNSAQTIQLTWTDGNGNTTPQIISTTNLINSIYPIADTNAVNLLGDNLSVQLFGPDGEPGQVAQAGVLSDDAPYFVDGRQHLKQNLTFMIRGASDSATFFAEITEFRYFTFGHFGFCGYDSYVGEMNQGSTNFEDISFLHHGSWNGGAYEDLSNYQLDNLWPFTINYDLANYFVDTTRTNPTPYGSTNFIFQPNFATNLPAPAMLTHADPYWILQPAFVPDYTYYGVPVPTPTNWSVTVTSTQTVASLASGGHNFFGLPYETGCEVDMQPDGCCSVYCLYQALTPGGSVTANPGYLIGDYANWCPAPTLQLVNYYFVPLANPNLNSMGLPGAYNNFWNNGIPNNRGIQPLTPLEDDFNVTNQTPPLMVGSVGQPMILASWAKYSIQGSSGKYAYLGQYFATNAFLLNANGNATTNVAGILSPYGEFFPLQAGAAALVTMPDIDFPYQQGTGVVRVVSLNVDANHDGTMDFSYFGPDQTSPSRPMRFWINDT